MTVLEKSILDQAYNHFVNSNDFNGLANYNLQSDASFEEVSKAIINLIDADYINIADGRYSINSHIIHSSFPSKKEQQALFENKANKSFCIYPSETYLKAHRNTDSLANKPFDKMMALGFPQLKALYFTPDVLVKYSIDPRFHFTFNDYYGKIHSTDDNVPQESIFLETFGIGRNGQDRIIVSFPRCLRKMSPQNQVHWASYLIEDSSNCETLQNYLDNALYGNWNFIQTVYRAILQEIENISVLTKGIWGHSFFRNTFKKEELEGFDMLFLPTKNMYNQFIMLLEKITVSNIDDKFFDTIQWNRIGDDGKMKGSMLCLKEWLNVVTSSDVRDDIVNPLKELRHERQCPAHAIEGNEYSTEYLQMQNKFSNSIYGSLNLFKGLLQTHPKAKEIKIPHDKTQYYVV